jgi:hypothetical protein
MLYIRRHRKLSKQTKQKARSVTGERPAIPYAHGYAFLSAVADCSGL